MKLLGGRRKERTAFSGVVADGDDEIEINVAVFVNVI